MNMAETVACPCGFKVAGLTPCHPPVKLWDLCLDELVMAQAKAEDSKTIKLAD